jgi:hypothetical protein
MSINSYDMHSSFISCPIVRFSPYNYKNNSNYKQMGQSNRSNVFLYISAIIKTGQKTNIDSNSKNNSSNDM